MLSTRGPLECRTSISLGLLVRVGHFARGIKPMGHGFIDHLGRDQDGSHPDLHKSGKSKDEKIVNQLYERTKVRRGKG